MIASGYSALEAKNSGIMISWPMPMKRSRSCTSEASSIDRQANAAVPSISSDERAERRRATLQRTPMPATASTTSSSDRLHERAHARAGRLAEHDRAARQRRREQALQLADVALPDHGQAEEDRDEHRRLGHHAGREVGAVVDRAAASATRLLRSAVPKMNSHSSGCTERVMMSRWSWRSLRSSAQRHRERAVGAARRAGRRAQGAARELSRAGGRRGAVRGHR